MHLRGCRKLADERGLDQELGFDGSGPRNRPGFYGSLSLASFATAYNSAYDPVEFQHVFLWGNQPSDYTRNNLGLADNLHVAVSLIGYEFINRRRC